MAILTWRVRAALGLAAALLVSMGRLAQAQERERDRGRPAREDRGMGRGEREGDWMRFDGRGMDRFRLRRLGGLGRDFRYRGPRDFGFRFRMPPRPRGFGPRVREWGPVFGERARAWGRFGRGPLRGEMRDRIRERLRSRHWRHRDRFGRI